MPTRAVRWQVLPGGTRGVGAFTYGSINGAAPWTLEITESGVTNQKAGGGRWERKMTQEQTNES